MGTAGNGAGRNAAQVGVLQAGDASLRDLSSTRTSPGRSC